MERKRVAIVGASPDRGKYGNKSVRAHRDQGWEVYPVHPSAEEIEGLRAYSSLEAIPVKLDRISLYVPPAVGIELLPQIAAAGAEELFVNPGAESEALIAAAEDLGLDPIQACSIVAIGTTPEAFSE